MLPIFDLLTPLRDAFKSHSQVILEAPTGAGKSTALPLAMLDWHELQGKILMLEPRRVAARRVAHYIAQQRGSKLGAEVGYRVRGESKASAETRLEVVTEGVLTRMIQQDPELTGVAMVIFDEIHERHITTDLGLALALEVQAGFREDLKLLAMSATLSGLPLSDLMPEAISLKSEGRSFPVTLAYQGAPANAAWIEHMGKCIVDLVAEYQSGSLLAFLPGQGEISRLQQYLSSRLDPLQYQICPLYGSLPATAQDKAIAPAAKGIRKIVLATNVAESSLTIDGITLVVDSGYKRQASFNPKTGVTRLSLKRISQASAAQRSGRAGRLSAGFCLRLWPQEEHGRLLKADEPEIVQSDLLSMTLDGAYWGVKALAELPLITQATPANERVAWQLLTDLEILDDNRCLTPLGRAAYALGCHPRLAHMLLKAKALAAQGEQDLPMLACLIAGVLESRGRQRRGVDIGLYLQDALQGESGQQVKQWLAKLALLSSNSSININAKLAQVARDASQADIALLLALAYPDRIAKSRGVSGYQLANGTGVELDNGDPLANSPWLVICDFQETAGKTQGRVYLASAFDAKLFDSNLAFLVKAHEHCGWDDNKGRFFAESQRRIGQIVLGREPIKNVDKKLIQQALIEQVSLKGLSLLKFDEKCQQLQHRVKLAAEYDASNAWPDMSCQALLNSLDVWLAPYIGDVRSLTQLAAIDCYALLHNLLPWELQQRLKALLPTSWLMATGTHAQIHYDETGRALLSVRLQEALGLQTSPVLANGKLVVTMELLSPARRPLALTADLASFWQGPYAHVKKEMKGRYPKHLWPDDPANTQPTKFTKKKTLNLKP